MKKNLFLVGICVILIAGGFLIYQTISSYQEVFKVEETPSEEESQTLPEEEEPGTSTEAEAPQIFLTRALEEKSIAMVVAFKGFQDEEYFATKQLLYVAGAETKTVSTEEGTATGAYGGTASVDLLLKDLNLADFDAIVFIGGSGCLGYLDNEDSYKLIKDTISQDKVLAAICISPVILAKAGVLEGKKATVWSSPTDKSAVKILKDNKAIYQEEPVVTDGKIITASGPDAVEEFGMTVIEVLTK